jgi:expansin (peptidoglycan-binding protein)
MEKYMRIPIEWSVPGVPIDENSIIKITNINSYWWWVDNSLTVEIFNAITNTND